MGATRLQPPHCQVVTAGRANDALATACTPDERNWLLALIAVCGTVSLFLNLESYERHWDEPEEVACDPTRSLYRKSWYEGSMPSNTSTCACNTPS